MTGGCLPVTARGLPPNPYIGTFHPPSYVRITPATHRASACPSRACGFPGGTASPSHPLLTNLRRSKGAP
jgi:hypothetical protein